LFKVGIYTELANDALPQENTVDHQLASHHISDKNDPWLERQIESVWILVDSYMRIVCKTLADMIPKCIVFELINGEMCVFMYSLSKCHFIETLKHVCGKLVVEMSRIDNVDTLMTENGAIVSRKKTLHKIKAACTSALEVLDRMPATTRSHRPHRKAPKHNQSEECKENGKYDKVRPSKSVSTMEAKPATIVRQSSQTIAPKAKQQLNEAVTKHITSDKRSLFHV
jgi:hypothetical protein